MASMRKVIDAVSNRFLVYIQANVVNTFHRCLLVGLTEGDLFRPSCPIMSCPPPGGSLYLLIHSNMLHQFDKAKMQDVGKTS